jgi:uncharacterized membrane protein
VIFAFMVGFALLMIPSIRVRFFKESISDLGKLHPLVLHFPIVLILFVFVFELARLYLNRTVQERYIWILLEAAAWSALLSVVTGYLLHASGEYSGAIIVDHLWSGCITAALTWISIGLYEMFRKDHSYYPLYSICLLAAVLSTFYTGHLGGTITHGKEYLPEIKLFSSEVKDTTAAIPSSSLYHDIIEPVFEMKCISCHNDLKSKGGLSMKSYSHLVKAGTSTLPSITPGDPLKSEIYNRIVLPADHKDHMPPDGKTPMTADEIAIVKYWIEQNAREDFFILDTLYRKDIIQLITREQPRVDKFKKQVLQHHLELGEVQNKLDLIGKKIGVDFIKDPEEDGNLFIIQSKFPPAPFSNRDLILLKPYYDLFSKVSLISTAIDDDGLYYLGQMPNLKKLLLQKSKVSGNGLIYLKSLKQLEVLNLSFTKVDDQGAMFLMTFPPNLKKVYLYRTKATKEVAAAVSKYHPGISILMEEGPYN